MPFVTANGRKLDYRWIAPARPEAPPLVFLHEGLGSIELWREFPDRVAAATGCGVLIYSRYGYGRSDRLDGPRPLDYLHQEALIALPEVLERLGLVNPVLIGHSDGASIALIHAGAGRWPVRALILEAPHVFVEEVTLAGIVEAKRAFETTDLRHRLARYHVDAEATFRGWSETWLNPDFRTWNIEEVLPGIRAPILAIQGEDDEYGTLAQLDAIAAQAGGPVHRLVLPRCGHTPHRERAEEVLDAMTRFIAEL